jgi:hypothetical protein
VERTSVKYDFEGGTGGGLANEENILVFQRIKAAKLYDENSLPI